MKLIVGGARPCTWLLLASLPGVVGALGSCGGGSDGLTQASDAPMGASEGTAGGTGPSSWAPGSGLSPSARITSLKACEPSGVGKDYPVGPGAGQLASLDQVPWEGLMAGDTVRIFHKEAPYRGKMLLTGNGTPQAPIRVCGVRGSNGERPVVDGSGATTRPGLDYGSSSNAAIQQARAVVMIKNAGECTHYPTNIQVDGLVIRGAHPGYRFRDTAGATRQYEEFGACIWIDRGHDILIADNEVTDCTNGLFSKSTDDGPFAVTRNVRLVGNYIHGNGVADSDRLHNSYIQSVGAIYEFNFYGPLRANAGGSAIKDRSVGTVVRFNRIEEGARSIDLVEAEDYPETALANPAYRTTYVYGNQVVKNGDTGSFFHYGGDHHGSKPGGDWGEPLFRKGTLYFYHNTVRITGTGEWSKLFQLSTTEEKAEVWNNVFYFEPGIPFPSMRQSSEVGEAWTSGGILNLGRNWINSNWMDSDDDHPVPGQLNGKANLITGTASPIDLGTLAPLAGSPIVDAASELSGAVAQHPVDYQLDGNFVPQPRAVTGSAAELGAKEL
jgi:hypothetical protein